jgi:phosphate transport system protein
MRLIESEINSLKNSALDMAGLVQIQFEYLIEAVHTHDPIWIERIRKKEQEIDAFDNKIDRRCARVLALYQPVANDLRFVFSVLKVNGYLEQMGDLVNYIGRKMLKYSLPFDENFRQELRLREMLVRTSEMLTVSLDSFFTENPDLARQVFPMDDLVDDIHRASFDTIVRRIQAEPHNADTLLQLAFSIRNIEKIADLCVCVAEETIFHTEAEVYKHTDMKNAHRRQDNPSLGNSNPQVNSSRSITEDGD